MAIKKYKINGMMFVMSFYVLALSIVLMSVGLWVGSIVAFGLYLIFLRFSFREEHKIKQTKITDYKGSM